MKLIALLLQLSIALAATRVVISSPSLNRKNGKNGKNGKNSNSVELRNYDTREWDNVRIMKSCKSGKGRKGSKRSKCTTEAPTAAPTISPRPTVSVNPSSRPTVSSMPSHQPSDLPSLTPSVSPTSNPSSTPTLSSSPSKPPTDVPSPSPSDHPTNRPSTSPSVAPTSRPSASPTHIPTPSPSDRPTNRPSTSPSVAPTPTPSWAPTPTPSWRPTPSPSDFPTTSPSKPPTLSPSVSPSSSPSISLQPSPTPSISQKPSNDIVTMNEYIYDNQGLQIGIKSGCPAPKEINSTNYAEVFLSNITVAFQYMIGMDVTSDVDVDNVIQSMDYTLHTFVFEKYVECQGGSLSQDGSRDDDRLRRLHSVSTRSTRMTQSLANDTFYNEDKAMGVSSLPADTLGTVTDCPDTIEGKKCVIVNGGVSLLFEKKADVGSSHQSELLLAFIRNEMNNGTVDVTDDRVRGLMYVNNGDSPYDGGTIGIDSLTRNEDGMRVIAQPITLLGGMMIGSGVLLLFGSIGAIIRRRPKYTGYAQENATVLKMLDKEYDGEFSDADFDCNFNDFSPQRNNFPITLIETQKSGGVNGSKQYLQLQIEGENEDEFELSPFTNNDRNNDNDNHHRRHRHRHHRNRSSKKDLSSFPVQLSETRNGKRIPVSRSRQKTTANNPTRHSNDTGTQDVHYCTSALCKECSGGGGGGGQPKSKIKFISSNDWYEDIEVDLDSSSDKISDNTIDFSKPSTMKNRSYGRTISDTVYV